MVFACPEGSFPGGTLSWVVLVLEGNCHGVVVIGDTCPIYGYFLAVVVQASNYSKGYYPGDCPGGKSPTRTPETLYV